jgi:hypothetical protein
VNKIFIVSALALIFVACSVYQVPPYETEKRAEKQGPYIGLEGVVQKQKDQAYSTNQANKAKCQDARLDLVDVEATGDINMIRQVKVRVQKLCVVTKK